MFLDYSELFERKESIKDYISSLGRVIVAFSGGVDSTVVAALAYEAIDDSALAVIIDSPFFPRSELEEAKKVAEEIGIKYEVLQFNELTTENIRKNPIDRCYTCKKARYKALKKFAEKKGFDYLLEGTNASDLSEYRPGLAASDELDVKKPLLMFEFSKQDTRNMAELLGLSNALKPSNSCLAARVPYDEELTLERLRRVENCEEIIREETGAKVIRARDHGDLLRIELGSNERKQACGEQTMDNLYDRIKALGFRFVVLDLKGYRFGSYDK
jgi:uncharacterized protein